MRSPGFALAVKWVSESWAEIDSNQLSSSFYACGITSCYALHDELDCFINTETIDSIHLRSEADDINAFEVEEETEELDETLEMIEQFNATQVDSD